MIRAAAVNEVETNAAEFDSFAEGYDQIYGGKDWVFFRDKVMPYTPEKAEYILDAGCGSGSVTLFLSDIGRTCVGIDLSSEMIKLAKRRSEDIGIENVTFVIADLNNLPFIDHAFDFTISANALHHTDIDTSLPELKRLASAGGSILVRDIVVNRPRLHRIALWHVIYNILFFPRLLKSKGARRALQLLTFELRPSWIRHKINQRLLSPQQFEDGFQRILPGCTFPEGPIGVAFWSATGVNAK